MAITPVEAERAIRLSSGTHNGNCAEGFGVRHAASRIAMDPSRRA